MNGPLLKIEHLEVRYGDLIGVSDVSLEVPEGSVVALLGSNGGGKTTVLNILAGLDTPCSGAVIVDNQAIEGPSLDRAVVFQSHALLPWRSVMGNVAYALGRTGSLGLRYSPDVAIAPRRRAMRNPDPGCATKGGCFSGADR